MTALMNVPMRPMSTVLAKQASVGSVVAYSVRRIGQEWPVCGCWSAKKEAIEKTLFEGYELVRITIEAAPTGS